MCAVSISSSLLTEMRELMFRHRYVGEKCDTQDENLVKTSLANIG